MEKTKYLFKNTTLIGKELFDYLIKLESELKNRISTSSKGSIESLMHSQMREIINAENAFLKYLNPGITNAKLSISLNGLPSVDSLNPDLEKMCEVSEEEKSFDGITKKFKKGMNGKNMGEGGYIYIPVSEEDWNKELKNRKKEKLLSDIGFSINETDDGKFELALREDLHLQGYDKYSREFPVLIREGRMRYQVAWNRLIGEVEESFYVPNTALVLKGKPTKPRKKIFDDIKRVYKFGRSDYKGVKKPWFFGWGRGSIDYSKFLAAGTNARVKTTENILEALKTALNRQVSIKGIGKNDLEQVLAFSMIPFKNAPTTTPKEEDFYENSGYSNHRGKPKIPTIFDLIFTSGVEKVGEIEYVLPHNKIYYGAYGGKSRRFTMGGVKLWVLGNAIFDENQNKNLKKELERVKKK